MKVTNNKSARKLNEGNVVTLAYRAIDKKLNNRALHVMLSVWLRMQHFIRRLFAKKRYIESTVLNASVP